MKRVYFVNVATRGTARVSIRKYCDYDSGLVEKDKIKTMGSRSLGDIFTPNYMMKYYGDYDYSKPWFVPKDNDWGD